MTTAAPQEDRHPAARARGRATAPHRLRWSPVPVLAAVVLLAAGGSAQAVPAVPGRFSTASTPAGATATPSGVRQVRVIGYSRQHRAINAYELGNPAAPTKDLVLGSMHGFYERAGEQVIAGIRTLPIPDNLDLWVIPTINPDGDLLGQRANAGNVDLNRNWPNLWQFDAGDPGNKLDNHASGPQPLSEPETRAMYRFLQWLKPARMVSMHQPLVGVDTTDGGGLPQGAAFRNALAANLGLPLTPLTCFGGCHGSMTGWLTHYTSTVAITVEFGPYEPPAYLTGRAARGVLAALLVGVKPWVPPARTPPPAVIGAMKPLSTSWSTGITATGWSADPQRVSGANTVTVWVDGRPGPTVTAGGSSAEVDRVRHLLGGHGFSVRIPAKPGRHTICVVGHAFRGTTSTARFLGGCQKVAVPPKPVMNGHVDVAAGSTAGITVSGWVIDPLHPLYRGYVRLQISRRPALTVMTGVQRPDVNRAWATSGAHGFQSTVPLPPGRYWVTVTALNPATASSSTVLTSHEVDVPGG